MRNGDEGSPTGNAQVDWDVLARFLAGESPAEEAQAVRVWLAEDPARHDVLSALDTTLDRVVAAPPADLDVEAALRGVHARMDAAETPVTPFRAPVRRAAPAPRAMPAPWLRAAAAIVLLLGVGWFAWRMMAPGASAAAVAFSTGVGERDTVQLVDGTTVILGPGSRLALAEGYGKKSREVRLRGEALFDVRHDDARPFTVRAGDAWVRDIGTTFSVVADSAAGVRVVVTQGAVALRAAEKAEEVVLRRGDRGTLSAGRVRAERAAATDDDVAWTRGRLVFRDAPLDQVAADLRRWYGVELRAADSTVAGRRLTASFEGEPPDAVLRVVSLALGAEVEVRGDTALLRAAPPGAP